MHLNLESAKDILDSTGFLDPNLSVYRIVHT